MLQPLTNLWHECFIEPHQHAKRHYQDIDPKIEKLVALLNTVPNVTTIGSCQGHCFGRSTLPYIYFYAPVEFASWLHQWCYQQQCLDKKISALNWPWEINGHFDDDGKQTFLLSTPALPPQCSIPLIRQRLLGWCRQHWDKDLLTITRRVSSYKEKNEATLEDNRA